MTRRRLRLVLFVAAVAVWTTGMFSDVFEYILESVGLVMPHTSPPLNHFVNGLILGTVGIFGFRLGCARKWGLLQSMSLGTGLGILLGLSPLTWVRDKWTIFLPVIIATKLGVLLLMLKLLWETLFPKPPPAQADGK